MPRHFGFGETAARGLVVAIFGPTASGKSFVAAALAQRIEAEVISADSMQVYRGVPILTNQPQTPTKLVGVWPLDYEASVGAYQKLAHAEIDAALERGATPIVAGGSGLYFRAALADLEIPPAVPAAARARWENAYDRLGADRAHGLLAERDPEAAQAVHQNDRRRVVRALELAEIGRSLSHADSRLWASGTRYPTIIFGLEIDREVLAQRIHRRTIGMFEQGVEEEVARALRGSISSTARYIIGLDEVHNLPREEAIEAIAKRTRALAAYQRKWMRRVPSLISIVASRAPETVAAEIHASLEGARAFHRRTKVDASTESEDSRG